MLLGPFLLSFSLCQSMSSAKNHRKPGSGTHWSSYLLLRVQCPFKWGHTRTPVLPLIIPCVWLLFATKVSDFPSCSLQKSSLNSPTWHLRLRFSSVKFISRSGSLAILRISGPFPPVAFIQAVVKIVSRTKLYLRSVLLCDLGQVISPL